MLEGVFNVIIATNNVGNTLIDVVDDVRDVKDRRAVAADDCEILDILGFLRHMALNDIVEFDDTLLGHLEHHDRTSLAVPRSLLALVGVAGRDQLINDLEMTLHVLRLIKDLFVIVEPEPFHALKQHLNRLWRRTFEVGVFDAEQKLAADMAGIKPIVNCGTDIADMNLARRRRGETNSDVFHTLNIIP